MEFRDGPSLAKGTVSLPDLGWRCPFPGPRHRMPSVRATFPSFFHLPVLGRMEEGCPLGALPGPPQVRSSPPRPIHTAQAKGFPSAHAAFTANAVLAQPPPPFGGPCLPEGRGITGWGPIGDPGEGEGGGMKTLSYLMLVPAGEGSQKKRKGCLAGTFLSFISRFFLYLNLQICIIQGQPIKEDYNGGHWESEVCVGEGVTVETFLLPSRAIPVCDTSIRDLEAAGLGFKVSLSCHCLRPSWIS